MAESQSFRNELRAVLTPKTGVLFVSSFVIPAAAFMLYPFLTIYFTHRLHFSPAGAGLLLSVRFLSSAVLGFVGGWISDRIGLLRTYALAALVTAIAIVLLAFQATILPIVVLLVVMGLSGSTVNNTVRGLSNQGLPDAHRGTGQNVIHWLNNIGMAVALPISSFALRGGLSRTPFLVAAAAYLVMAFVMVIAFGRQADPAPSTPAPKHASSPWAILRQDRSFRFVIIAFILWVAVEMQFESNVPLDLSYHLPHGAALFGALGAIDMIIVFVLQLIVSHWLAKQKSPWYGYAGFVLLGGLAVGGIFQTTLGWAIAIVLLSVGEVFSISQIMALMGVLPREGQQGGYFALFGMAQGFATFLAYSLGGTIYQTLHPTALFILCIPAAILSAIFYSMARRTANIRHQEVA